MMRLCSYCGCEKFYDPNPFLNGKKASGFCRARCWDCYLVATAKANAKTRSTPEGRAKHNQASSTWAKANRAKSTANTQRYRVVKLNRIAPWANQRIIDDMYVHAARLGLAVDHIIPLNGELVSGLHVEDNLQLISKSENSRKSNRFDPTEFSPITGEPLCL